MKTIWRTLNEPTYSCLKLILWCTCVAFVVGKDGIKSAIAVFLFFIVCSLFGILTACIRIKFEKKI